MIDVRFIKVGDMRKKEKKGKETKRQEGNQGKMLIVHS